MSYMTIEEQIASHLTFLKNEGMDVEKLFIDRGFIRCNVIGETQGRGELCYQTKKTLLKNGYIGLATWARTKGGGIKTYKTYGIPDSKRSSNDDHGKLFYEFDHSYDAVPFWNKSEPTGESDYLLEKGVGYYGIRFRQTSYGKIAIVPMRDYMGNLCTYQMINPDGSKRFGRAVSTIGLFHMLHKPIDGCPIGLAESYVTAATCFEVTGIAMVTYFYCDNLKHVSVELRKKYPNSPLFIFADDDRHLEVNKGRNTAYAAQKEIGTKCEVIIPDFADYPISRAYSDWNDYVRSKGVKATREAIYKILKIDWTPHK